MAPVRLVPVRLGLVLADLQANPRLANRANSSPLIKVIQRNVG